MEPIGTPGGITGSNKIVAQYVQLWCQEARELKAHAAKDVDGKSQTKGDADSDEEGEEVFEEDLVKFVMWSQGKWSVICLPAKLNWNYHR